jgi:DNA-binding NarL/FixJ family response regulator
VSSEGASSGAPATRILLIGHEPTDGHSIREALADVRDHSFVVDCAPRLLDGLERLSGNAIVVVLLDLCLPDSEGVVAFEQIRRAAPHLPIIVIGGPDDDAVAREVIKRGAQDYLRRDRLDSYTLPRALERVIERKATEEALFFERQRATVTLTRSATPCSAPICPAT